MFKCKQCGSEFTRPHKNRPALYCSRDCKAEAESKIADADRVVTLYESGRSSYDIARELGVSRTLIDNTLAERRVQMRDRADHVLKQNPMQGKQHTNATKQKIREASIKQFASPEARAMLRERIMRRLENNTFSLKSSKLEDDVAKQLETEGIVFQRQKKFREANGQFIAVVDFFFPETNTALEVNGTFWHCDKRKYPDGPKYPMQVSTLKKYDRKVNYLQSQGILVKELWEIDFKQNPQESVKTLLKG